MKDSVIEVRRRFSASFVAVEVLRILDSSYEPPLEDRVRVDDLYITGCDVKRHGTSDELAERLRTIGEGFLEISEEVREWAEREVEVEEGPTVTE